MDNFFGTYQSNHSGLKLLNKQKYENIFRLGENNGKLYYNLLDTLTLPSSVVNDAFFVIKTLPNETWTNISYRVYDTIELWWLIAIVNNIYNPFVLPQYIKVIKPDYIDLIIDNIHQQLKQ